MKKRGNDEGESRPGQKWYGDIMAAVGQNGKNGQ